MSNWIQGPRELARELPRHWKGQYDMDIMEGSRRLVHSPPAVRRGGEVGEHLPEGMLNRSGCWHRCRRDRPDELRRECRRQVRCKLRGHLSRARKWDRHARGSRQRRRRLSRRRRQARVLESVEPWDAVSTRSVTASDSREVTALTKALTILSRMALNEDVWRGLGVPRSSRHQRGLFRHANAACAPPPILPR